MTTRIALVVLGTVTALAISAVAWMLHRDFRKPAAAAVKAAPAYAGYLATDVKWSAKSGKLECSPKCLPGHTACSLTFPVGQNFVSACACCPSGSSEPKK